MPHRNMSRKICITVILLDSFSATRARDPTKPMRVPKDNERVKRRLMAILVADVAGYSRLVGADDEGTLARWKAHWNALISPKIKEHFGRLVRTSGDGILVEFASVVRAVRCAVEVQRGMDKRNTHLEEGKRIDFRIGIHFGDVIIDGRDVWGESVNVAARLEAISEPGGICVSDRAQEEVQGKLDITFEDIGERRLKNIRRPMRVYRVQFKLPEIHPYVCPQDFDCCPSFQESGRMRHKNTLASSRPDDAETHDLVGR
jgi:class 3 adenylate cyclase